MNIIIKYTKNKKCGIFAKNENIAASTKQRYPGGSGALFILLPAGLCLSNSFRQDLVLLLLNIVSHRHWQHTG